MLRILKRINSRLIPTPVKLASSNGQGLVEAMIAVTIIIVGVIASLTLVISTLFLGKRSANQLVAANLAWEGIEVIRNIRDSNFLAGQKFDNGLTGEDNSAILVYHLNFNTWGLNFTTNSLNDSAAQLYRHNGLYLQNAARPPGQPTEYSRLITVTPVGNPVNELRVISTVAWQEKKSSRSVSAQINLYNWR